MAISFRKNSFYRTANTRNRKFSTSKPSSGTAPKMDFSKKTNSQYVAVISALIN